MISNNYTSRSVKSLHYIFIGIWNIAPHKCIVVLSLVLIKGLARTAPIVFLKGFLGGHIFLPENFWTDNKICVF